MRLTSFDEYPFHQHPTPFHVPATSDVHFNDGYFCATFAQDWYLVCGIRLHPNMNVIDGFAGLARGGEQPPHEYQQPRRQHHTRDAMQDGGRHGVREAVHVEMG